MRNYIKSGLRNAYVVSGLICRRVHVSEKTLSFLNDEFEVEPGHGEKREEILRIAGIKTYFIVRVRKPVSLTKTYQISPPLCGAPLSFPYSSSHRYIKKPII